MTSSSFSVSLSNQESGKEMSKAGITPVSSLTNAHAIVDPQSLQKNLAAQAVQNTANTGTWQVYACGASGPQDSFICWYFDGISVAWC